VLTGGLAAIPVGRLADRRGVRGLVAGGALLGGVGLLGFASATGGWQVLAIWWVVLGPATALTFYEPAYVAIQQAFTPEARPKAIAVLTLSAGLSGPIFIPLTGALVEGSGWRDATRALAAVMACAAPVAWLFISVRPPTMRPAVAPVAALGSRRRARVSGPDLTPLRERRVWLFTAGAVLAYGAVEAVVVHRVAGFQELGFGLGTVTFWAGVSGLITLPGRFLLPVLARRMQATTVLALVLGVLALGTALMISGDAYWQMALFFVLFGLVFGAALPLRAIVMGEWTPTATFGAVMGLQAALIAGGRASMPAIAGGLHDVFDGYASAFALLTAVIVFAAVLVARSGTDRAPHRPSEERGPRAGSR
jgi:MFS family permease